MQTYYICWVGTSSFYQVQAETSTKAKIKIAKSENLNPLLVCDRLQAKKKPTEQDKLTAIKIS